MPLYSVLGPRGPIRVCAVRICVASLQGVRQTCFLSPRQVSTTCASSSFEALASSNPDCTSPAARLTLWCTFLFADATKTVVFCSAGGLGTSKGRSKLQMADLCRYQRNLRAPITVETRVTPMIASPYHVI